MEVDSSGIGDLMAPKAIPMFIQAQPEGRLLISLDVSMHDFPMQPDTKQLDWRNGGLYASRSRPARHSFRTTSDPNRK